MPQTRQLAGVSAQGSYRSAPAEHLGLEVGETVSAVVKASNVNLAVNE